MQIASFIDHTLLKPTSTLLEIEKLCKKAQYTEALSTLATLQKPIDNFFDHISTGKLLLHLQPGLVDVLALKY